jgi:uncharacterized protein (DUF924 family)
MPDVSPEDVLAFWFGAPPTDEPQLMARIERWFRGSEAFDREVVARFAEAVRAAVDGRLDGWRETARGTLALVILLDQFTRNVFRDRPEMYAGDARAQEIALEAFDDRTADELGYVEQLFLSMPLLHAEDLALQERSVEIVRTLAPSAPPLFAAMAAMHLEQSTKYRAVIARFGRFPHRNALLGRAATSDEMAFLADWDSKQPPAGMPPVAS